MSEAENQSTYLELCRGIEPTVWLFQRKESLTASDSKSQERACKKVAMVFSVISDLLADATDTKINTIT